MDKKKILKILFRTGNVYFNPKKPLIGGSGFPQPIYTDHRGLCAFVKEREIVIGGLINIIKKKIGLKNIDMIAGIETSGIPLGAILAEKLKRPFIFIRKNRKKIGKQKQIEGEFKKGAKILLVDDMIASGAGIIKFAKILERKGGEVKNCLAISSLESEKTKQNFKKSKLKRHYLVSFPEIIRFGVENRYFSKKDKKVIDEYLADAINWGKEHGFKKLYK